MYAYVDVDATGCRLSCMSDAPSMEECLSDLPNVAVRASQAVYDLYEAIRQARAAGATYDQLCSATGMVRGTVQNVLDGKTPKFAAD